MLDITTGIVIKSLWYFSVSTVHSWACACAFGFSGLLVYRVFVVFASGFPRAFCRRISSWYILSLLIGPHIWIYFAISDKMQF